MRKSIFFLLIFLIIPISLFAQKKVRVTLFYSNHCKACYKVRKEAIPQIKEKYRNSVTWRELNTSADIENLNLLVSLTKQFNLDEVLIPSIIVGDIFLVGGREIADNLSMAIDKALKEEKSISFP